ncbi:MAG: hypothetical protein KGL39_27425, partial [Patescibacteria group bacterium]|nr:hypothetical protein [Patescibacteria group bacterium]
RQARKAGLKLGDSYNRQVIPGLPRFVTEGKEATEKYLAQLADGIKEQNKILAEANKQRDEGNQDRKQAVTAPKPLAPGKPATMPARP